MADKWVTYIDIVNKFYSTSSTSFVPTDKSIGVIEWDGSKYSGISEVYLEAVMRETGSCLPNQSHSIQFQLYDYTNTTAIGTTTSYDSATSWKARRSSNIEGSIPSGVAELGIQIKMSCGTAVELSGCRIVVVQTATATPKTRIYLPVGGSYTNIAGTTYNDKTDPKFFKYDADHYATIDAIYIGGTFRDANAGGTATLKVDNLTQTDELGNCQVSGTTYDWNKSGDVSANITDEETYVAYIKSSISREGASTMQNAYIIIDLNPVTKYQGVLTISTYEWLEGSTTYTEEDIFEHIYDNIWSGVNVTLTQAGTLKKSAAMTTADCRVFDDTSAISGLDIGTGTTSYVWTEGGSNAEPADGSYIGMALKRTGGGVTDYTYSGVNFLLQEVTDITAFSAAVMQINIGDTWKDVDSMQINIGDTWKDVSGAQINIGDSWKTIF